jgi:hypothetical protein
MQYFVRTMERHKESLRQLSPEVPCSALDQAIEQAKRTVLESDRAVMLQADACSRNRHQVRTKYRCWIDERGTFNERALV